MPLPRIAIVGRPNVGKSSLMNMIAASKVSIVDPTAGTTRDRVSAIVELDPPVRMRGAEIEPPKPVEIIDTGGFGVYVEDGQRLDEVGNDLARLTSDIEGQIREAVASADAVLLVVDAQVGVTPADRQIALLLRKGALGTSGGKGKAGKAGPTIRVVANKVDGPKWESYAAEVAELGFGAPILVSARNNYMRREFLDSLHGLVPLVDERDMPHRAGADMLLAIIGKRNAGKSTLVNTLAGQERVIASEIPGTTRDAVDVRLEFEGRTIVAIDTAGLRRKRSFQHMIEHYAYDRLQRSVDRCDVALVMVDATEPISQVDEQVAMLTQKAYRPAVIVVNKWDLVEGQRDHKGKRITTKMYEDYIRDELRGLWYAPISFISAQNASNVADTIRLALELRGQASERVTTGKLNRLIRAVLEQRGPSDRLGRFAKVYYVAQTGVEPPTITLVVNHPDMFTPNYLRFLSNRLREQLPYGEVPIRLVVRARRQREDDLVSAEEGGSGHTIRVSRGRKGVDSRLTGRRLQATSVDAEGGLDGDDGLGDLWLSDEHSAPVRIDEFDLNAQAKAFGDDRDPEAEGMIAHEPSKRARQSHAIDVPTRDAVIDQQPKRGPAKQAMRKKAASRPATGKQATGKKAATRKPAKKQVTNKPKAKKKGS